VDHKPVQEGSVNMAVLPDPTGIARRTPSGQRGVASADASVISRAVSDIGGTVFKIGQQKADKQDRYELALAKSKWISARSDAESSFDGDKEFGTMENRYRDGLAKQMDDIGGGIRNAQVREEFRLQQQSDLELGSNRIQAKAFGVEKDHHKGLLVDDLNSLRESALKMNSAEAIETMQERIDAASEMGYLSDAEAAKLRQTNAVDYAVSKIEMSPASAREEMLKGPLGKYIPADKAHDISEKAKAERVENESMLTVDVWMAQGLSLDEGITEASKIKDPDVRKATEERFKLQYQVEKKAVQDEQNNLYQDYASQIENGEVSYSSIPRSDRDKMTVIQRSNLQKVGADKATGRAVKTDIPTYDHLNVLLANKDYTEARQYYLDNYPKLSQSDRKAYSKITVDAMSESVEIESFFTKKEYLKSSAETAGIGKTENVVLQQRLDEWYQGYQIANDGKIPSDPEVQATVDSLLLRRPDTGWFTDDFMFEAETASAEVLLKNENQSHLSMVAAEFEKKFGRIPTSDELVMHYFSNKRKGKFDGD
jgi:hypothetical protein